MTKSVEAQSAGNPPSYDPRGSKGLLWRVASEPLVQFMLLGALLFIVHAAVTPAVSKERLIEVTPQVRQSIIDAFKTSHENRPPEADELARLIDVWILNEITFREALVQGLDKGDEMIRDRITHKMRLLIFGGVEVEEPTQAELEAWYQKHRDRYDIPDTASFITVPFQGATAEADARAVLAQILAGDEPEEVRMRAIIYSQRPRHALDVTFGKAFTDTLVELPKGEWRMLPYSDGWQVVRLDKFDAGRRVPLEEVGTQAALAWKDERRRVLAIAATREIGKSYVIKRDEP